MILLTRPISAVLMGISIILLVFPLLPTFQQRGSRLPQPGD